MSEYIDTLLEALKSIDLSNCAIKVNGKMTFINERSFAYELYRAWNVFRPSDLVINAEVTKKIDDKKYSEKAKELFGKNVKRFSPDIVLHGGQKDFNRQEIICEIKDRKYLRKDSFCKDIKKLKAYTTEDEVLIHEFKTGFFILINGNASDVANKITDESLSLISDSKILFLFMTINDKKAIPILKTLSEIIEIRNNLKNSKI